MSKYDKWIEYRKNKKERARSKSRADGIREYLAYREMLKLPANEVKKPARARKPKRNQPGEWSFLDE